MKYCYGCGRLTPGNPLFCMSCGSSYDLKLCPRMHPNPRHAEVCSQCGSREFSTPQPAVSVGKRLIHALERALVILCVLALALAALVTFLSTPQGQNAVIAFAILGALLWWLWSLIPKWLRQRIHRPRKGRRPGHDQ